MEAQVSQRFRKVRTRFVAALVVYAAVVMLGVSLVPGRDGTAGSSQSSGWLGVAFAGVPCASAWWAWGIGGGTWAASSMVFQRQLR